LTERFSKTSDSTDTTPELVPHARGCRRYTYNAGTYGP